MANSDDPTRRMDPPPSGETDPTVALDANETDEASAPSDDEEPESSHRVLRTVVIGLIGAVIGFALAFLIVALATDDGLADEEARQAHIEELETELDERDARIAQLEAQLAEAEAAAGGREQDIEAQRQALDERAAALEEWSDQLAEREAAIEQREAELDEREREQERERTADDDADDGIPVIDDETVDTIVERVLDQIREWFGR